MVGAKLGLLGQASSPSVKHSMEISESVIKYIDSDLKEHNLSLQTLTPEELLSVSKIKYILDHVYLYVSLFFFLKMNLVPAFSSSLVER